MRELVGPTSFAAFDNPSGELLDPTLGPERHRRVFDFGCGCGRVARRLIQQDPRPERYVGIDIHRGMVDWCNRNLAPRAPGFEFHHHDVAHPWNPGTERTSAAFLVRDGSFTLAWAWSVFTHLTEDQIAPYLAEVARILEPGGAFVSTWFLFDRRAFPVLPEDRHALYADDRDLTWAVIYDRDWVREQARAAGLTIFSAEPPEIRGYHWVLRMAPAGDGLPDAVLPPDEAPFGTPTR
jgi:SAM-dependent methyltransferase